MKRGSKLRRKVKSNKKNNKLKKDNNEDSNLDFLKLNEIASKIYIILSVILLVAIIILASSRYYTHRINEGNIIFNKIETLNLNKENRVNQTKEVEEIKVNIHRSLIKGRWYPENKDKIINEIRGYEEDLKRKSNIISSIDRIKNKKILGIILPHAGWRFSGEVAFSGVKTICNKSYKRVIILAPSHYANFKGASVGNFSYYETPLGLVKIDKESVDTLLKKDLFTFNKKAHTYEHAIEIELPFLQYCLNNFTLVPILIGYNTNYNELIQIGKELETIIDDDTLIVVSSDFTHYGPNYAYIPFTEDIKENLRKLDFGAFNNIKTKQPKRFYNFVTKTKDTICGRWPIIILMKIIQDYENKNNKKVNVTLIYYNTSGEITHSFRNSVSYMTIAFSSDDFIELSKEEKKFLLNLARKTIESYLTTGRKPYVDESKLPEIFKKRMGCFVTLEKHGMLRGCIGHILPQEELYKCIMDNAINAAINDPRFNPVSYNELKDIEIEISILTIPKRLEFKDPEDLKNKLIPNVHGVILKRGFYQSTYLPQVWEQLPDKEDFLTHLCVKGGMEPLCWKDPRTEVYVYRAYVFSERDLE